MKKALLVTTVSGFIPQFEMNNVGILQKLGYEVHYATNYHMPSYGSDNRRLDGTGIIQHQIDFVRSPFSLKNRKVYKQLKALMKAEQFQLVHCHTPMGGVMTRLTAHATGTKPVIYTAHGFHFYKGSPWINWLCYYPMEKWLSRYTDQQICINHEDYERAKTFYSKRISYVPGVGIDLEKIAAIGQIDITEKKNSLDIPLDKKVILSAGELIPRKNHETMIRAIAALQDDTLIYVICGHGELEEQLKDLVKELRLESKVIFAGYRTDIFEIYQIADLYAFPSYQEGLPMALLEAMASGLPVLCSNIRGNNDLMEEVPLNAEGKAWYRCEGGALVNKADDVSSYAESITCLMKDQDALFQCRNRNADMARRFSKVQVEIEMRRIYGEVIDNV